LILITLLWLSLAGLARAEINVREWRAAGDGVSDDRQALISAFTAAKTLGVMHVKFPRGRYLISQYIDLHQFDGLMIEGEAGAVIVFPSADGSLATDPVADLNAKARAAFLVRNSSRVTFRNLGFEGDLKQANFAINAGVAIYANRATDLRIYDCSLVGGFSLLWQDAFAEDRGARLINCTSFGARGHLTVGNDASIEGCQFTLPETADFDRLGSTIGSSHIIYLFAGRSNVKILNNTFRNARTWGIKVSGSRLPIRHIEISGNTLIDCGGGIEVGADDVQEHADISIVGNKLVDCGTNRAGWNQGAAINVLGARSVLVARNQLTYTRDALANPAAIKGIHVSRYQPASTPVEQVSILDNQIVGHIGPGAASSPSAISTVAIEVDEAEEVRISGNQIRASAGVGIIVKSNVGLLIESNTLNNVVSSIHSYQNISPIVRNNLLIPGNFTSANTQLRFNGDLYPVSSGNVVVGKKTGASLSMPASVMDDAVRGTLK
jgi:hypothetical protein